jgi:hypothetical protein
MVPAVVLALSHSLGLAPPSALTDFPTLILVAVNCPFFSRRVTFVAAMGLHDFSLGHSFPVCVNGPYRPRLATFSGFSFLVTRPGPRLAPFSRFTLLPPSSIETC